ncbi:MAG: lytic transglycosylase domain-containing protein, partial [Pseudomonadota bacterium]
MIKRLTGTACLVIGLACVPGLSASASAQDTRIPGSMLAHYENPGAVNWRSVSAVPTILSENERARFQSLFSAIDAQDWESVEKLLQETKGGVLHQIALAEYYTHAKSPKISAERIAYWFAEGVHLPQSRQLGRMGAKRGLEYLPEFPSEQGLRYQNAAAKRIRPRSVSDGSMPGASRSRILDAIKNDNPLGAYEALIEVDDQLSAEARAEWRQRVAWSFYIENDDANALALAETISEGSGAWVAEGEWVAGLAAWRLGFCALSSEAFAASASTSTNIELTAAAHYWAHRALIRCREPGEAQPHLMAAAQYSDTLYGMLARDQLGLDAAEQTVGDTLTASDWQSLQSRPNVRVAAALMEVGRASLADEVLRHEAKIGSARGYEALSRLARELGLPSTQLFMAHNAPYGTQTDTSLRYPVASWRPKTGWRVDPALAFAHALQESNFRASAVSPANARGLMQIMPGTARDHNRSLNLGASYADLNDPEVNLTYGQRHLEMLRDAQAT